MYVYIYIYIYIHIYIYTITDETVAAATREIEMLDSRRSVLETTVLQAEVTSLSAEMESSSSSAPIPAFGGGYAKFVSAGMESSSSSSVPSLSSSFGSFF